MGKLSKPTHDTKCPDGFVCYGWRKVCKGGYVRFSQGKHFHEDLLPHVGTYVYVTLADPFGSNVEVYLDDSWRGRKCYPFNENQWFDLKCLPCRDKGCHYCIKNNEDEEENESNNP